MNRNSILFLAILASIFIAFQNCSRAKFNDAEAESPSSSVVTNEEEESNAVQKVSLQHVPGHREFAVNISGFRISDSGCKLQYERNKSVWTDFSEEFDCSQDIESAVFLLPLTNGWTNNFNSTGLRIRMVKTKDSSAVAYFSQNLTCVIKPASNRATPNIDENCNAQWDDFTPGPARTCSFDSGALTYGSAYACDQTKVCGAGKTATFKEHVSMHMTYFYTTPDCDYSKVASLELYKPTSTKKTRTGIVDPYPDSGCVNTGLGYYFSFLPNTWLTSKCWYDYNDDPTYY